jgi:hypothetical protein
MTTCNIPRTETNALTLKKETWYFFFIWTHTRFIKISTEISAEFPLCRKVPSYRQIICTHPVFIFHTQSNHSKSQL